MKYVFLLLLLTNSIFFNTACHAQDTPILPKIFVLGEYETGFTKISEEYQTPLLATCTYDLDKASGMWLSMMKEMEAYGQSIDYDLKGIKLWLYCFWNEDGSIQHLAYYLKPNSKFVPNPELEAFLKTFTNQYFFPLKYKNKFSHYGSVSFPTSPILYKEKASGN